MTSLAYPAAAAPADGDLLVLLPGRGDGAEAFAREGFVSIAARSANNLSLIAADATLGYYIRWNVDERLGRDLVEPARARGYRSVWLAGISMGGLGALTYAQNHPDTVTGVLAIAPFLGDDDVLGEIEGAGGVARWIPPVSIAPSDYQRRLWVWLKTCAPAASGCPAVWLGFGREDRFIRGERLLAATLPAERVIEVAGGHDWGPWRRVFERALPRMFARSTQAR
jgi:pimeloyl-ACP methyl ester carboxylesterase